jgi:MOSC domain-containing protein YiiM
MQELDHAEITRAAGVADDARGRPGDRQVTVLAAEAWGAACAELGADLPWTTRRANLLVSGIELEASLGGRIEIGDATFEITGETDPCRVMELQHAGLEAALAPAWRGGVTCRVLTDGAIAVGAGAQLVARGNGT